MNRTSLGRLVAALILALVCVGAAVLPAWAAPKHSKGGSLSIEAIRVGTATGPLSLRVRANVHTRIELRVNGANVTHPFQMAGKDAQEIQLRAGDGLVAGANHLRLRAIRAGGSVTVRRTVKVPGRALFANAGADTVATVDSHARLGAAPAPGAGPGGGAEYRWRIVGRSPGAAGTLSRRDQARSLLRATAPGTFELELEADPDGADGPQEPSFDAVTVTAAPDDPPIGAPLDTLAKSDGKLGISIGGDFLGGTVQPDGLSYAVLERTTRRVVASGEVRGGQGAGLDTLNDLAGKYGAGGNYMKYLMIVSGARGIPAAQAAAAARLFKALGAPRLTEENFAALRTGQQFSVVGIPGAPAGAATIRIPGGYTSPTSGAITGYLQKNQAVDVDGAPVYDYVAPEHPEFDTRTPASTATNDIVKVGADTYAGQLSANATAALHVVVLESLTLKLLDNLVLSTNDAVAGLDRKWQSMAAEKLKTAIERPGGPTVIIQTIGKPKAAGPEWAGIVRQVVRLGGNAVLVNALEGNNEYALVSRLGSEAPPAEAGTAYDAGPYPAPSNPPARLVGVLGRTRTSTFEPLVDSTPSEKSPEGGVNLDLVKLAYQPATAWPELAKGATPAELGAVEKYICEALNFCQKVDSCATLRDCFWKKPGADWDLKHSQLANLGYQDRGFKEVTFKAAKEELLREVADVANVQTYLRRLQEPLDKSAGESYVDLQNIGTQVWNSVQQPGPDNTTSWTLGLVGKIAAVGQLAGPPYSALAAGGAAIFGLASYLTNQEGQPILGSDIKAKASQLGTALYERIGAARRETAAIGLLLVSDYGKLTAASRHVDSDWSMPPNPATSAVPIRIAAKQWFYESLIPVAYPYLLMARAGNARQLSCELVDRAGWPNEPDSTQMQATIGYDGSGVAERAIFWFAKGFGGGSAPPAGIGDSIFRPRDVQDPGLGIEKMHFFTPRVFNNRIVHAIDHSSYCSVGFLPRFF